jgi:uncharacterized OB-fold protein
MRALFPLPDVEWEPTEEFWAAARREELAIPKCDGCGRFVWYPRRRCPSCGGETFTWTPVSGRGRLFTWTVVRHAFLPQFREKLPFVPALVALDEDASVRMVTEVVDCEPDELEVDMPLQVVFRPMVFPDVEGSVTAPFFEPVR